MDVNDRFGRQFRAERNASQEVIFIKEAVPQSTRYKTKWVVGIFKEWQCARGSKRAANFGEQEIQELTTRLEAFNGESLASCLVRQVCTGCGQQKWWKMSSKIVVWDHKWHKTLLGREECIKSVGQVG